MTRMFYCNTLESQKKLLSGEYNCLFGVTYALFPYPNSLPPLRSGIQSSVWSMLIVAFGKLAPPLVLCATL